MECSLRRPSLLLTVALFACGDDGGATTTDGTSSSSAATSSASSSSASTTSSGSGGHTGHECTTPADCNQTSTACSEPTCEDGMCGLSFLPQGTAVPDEDVDGDCQATVCDGAGTVVFVPDGADVDDDGNDCTADACDGVDPTHDPEPIDTVCATGGGAVCDGGGNCVECNDAGDCVMGDLCMMETCVPSGCNDTFFNGLETDVDCGGPDCLGCTDTLDCIIDDDCLSDFCHPMALVCATPTCMDGFPNGAETDTDCGGPCGDCPDGSACVVDGDCASGGCVQSVCGPINGCSLGAAQDLTSQSAVTVTFAGFSYTPKCIRVASGTQVTFQGSFASHPLQGGYVSGGVVPASSGPFVPVTDTGTSKTVTMTSEGTFPYYCQAHALSGMTGVVFVDAP